jgi:hypothetical protein
MSLFISSWYHLVTFKESFPPKKDGFGSGKLRHSHKAVLWTVKYTHAHTYKQQTNTLREHRRKLIIYKPQIICELFQPNLKTFLSN